jgi:NADP-dependent 3-hydroxy acid dehydrogenase YdfG
MSNKLEGKVALGVTVTGDVRAVETAIRTVKAADDGFRRIDILINNAGPELQAPGAYQHEGVLRAA